jgi:tRNA (guanine-N(7)-)-methyltransferase subunit TRM82
VVAGGGEPTLQVFDWTTGALLRRVDIFPTVLDYRRVRPSPRKIKNKKRAEALAAAAKNGPPASDDPKEPGFCVAPPGMMFPTGLNICLERIDSVVVDGKTVVVFFAEGCTAIHAFVLPEGHGEITVHSFPVSHPVLGFSRVPGSTNQLVLALDATYGKTEAEEGLAQQMFTTVEIAADGQMSDVSASNAELLGALAAPLSPTTPAKTITGLNLYPNLGLFPRWPGFEEDEELAGPEGDATPTSEYEAMAPKQLGRLKSQGVDVSAYLSKKRRKGKDGESQDVTPAESTPEGKDA